MKKKRTLSKTPRAITHSRKVLFSMKMREKISDNWVRVRKAMKVKRRKQKK